MKNSILCIISLTAPFTVLTNKTKTDEIGALVFVIKLFRLFATPRRQYSTVLITHMLRLD
jgi:hypothetical protein